MAKRSDRGLEFYLDLIDGLRKEGLSFKVDVIEYPTDPDRFSNLTLDLYTFASL